MVPFCLLCMCYYYIRGRALSGASPLFTGMISLCTTERGAIEPFNRLVDGMKFTTRWATSTLP